MLDKQLLDMDFLKIDLTIWMLKITLVVSKVSKVSCFASSIGIGICILFDLIFFFF